MRKILTCFFALALVAPAGHAADGAVSRVLPTGGDNTSSSVSRTNSSRVARRDASVSDANVRNSVSRVFSGTAPTDISASRSGVVSRAVAHSDNGRGGLAAAVNTVGRNERVSSASINANPSVRRAGLVLRPSTAEVGGRATIGNTGVQTGSNIDEQLRTVKSRASVQATPESIALAKERLENTAALNKSCQEQYNECMDQFCAVIDANQKRCSCSANISKYAKVESAVKDANTQLNEVAQRIRYVGLSADEIRAIMTETEAEEALSGSTDTSETRNMLEEIEDLIRNPNVSTSYSGNSSGGFNLDIDLDFSGESADMFSLDFLNNDTASSFSNLRGAELYSAAKKRCNTVLTQCKEAGATSAQITGNYDLAIDKDCVAYEQGLTKMNETLVSNVRSANLMLQKARLAVLQNKNQYDAKGCIGALESCMTDDMVCGADYFKCVDPTKKYIDENGEVVLGQNISKITDFMTDYNNANIDSKYLGEIYGGTTINEPFCAGDDGNDGRCVVKYLLTKIGTKDKVTDEGLCRAVLDKCQAYTYDKNGNYQPYNDVVTNYVQRAMVNIRAAQRNIISDYASSCMVDIANCYNQQVTQVNSWSSSASISSVYNVMRGACRNVALTCAYAVFDGEDELCPTGDNANPATCINSISEMFYNSMLCSDGQVYDNITKKCFPAQACTTSAGTVEQCTDGSCQWMCNCGAGRVSNLSGQCMDGVGISYNLHDMAKWRDGADQTKYKTIANGTLPLPLMDDYPVEDDTAPLLDIIGHDLQYLNNILSADSRNVYWCYKTTYGNTCVSSKKTLTSQQIVELIENGGVLNFSLASNEQDCKKLDVTGLEWNNNACFCTKGRKDQDDDFCNE